MIAKSKLGPALALTVTAFIATVYAAAPTAKPHSVMSSYLYTSALTVDKDGVAKVPPSFVWSAETSWAGIDIDGRNLPDERIMLRLHDPNAGCSAMTSQISLNLAERLHRELGAIIAAKRKDPSYQDRSHVNQVRTGVPVKRIVGFDENGVAIMETVPNGG